MQALEIIMLGYLVCFSGFLAIVLLDIRKSLKKRSVPTISTTGFTTDTCDGQKRVVYLTPEHEEKLAAKMEDRE
jgi:hypothetical protein